MAMFHMANDSGLFVAPEVACPAVGSAIAAGRGALSGHAARADGLETANDKPVATNARGSTTLSKGSTRGAEPSIATIQRSSTITKGAPPSVDGANVTAEGPGSAHTLRDLPYLPLYEAKMLHQFDHRWATYARDGRGWLEMPILTKRTKEGKFEPDTRDLTDVERRDTGVLAAPRYWVKAEEVEERLVKTDNAGNVLWRWEREWMIGFRRVCRSTDERSAIFSVIPRTASGDSVFCAFPTLDTPMLGACFYAVTTSFVFDYATRQKAGGINLSFFVVNQLPFLPPVAFAAACPWEPDTTLADWIAPRVLELVYTAHDLAGFARDLGHVEADGRGGNTVKPPFHWDPARRAHLRAELDAAFFHLYGISRDDAAYILDTFTVFKARDEERNGGAYKTKEKILAIYGQMANAMVGPAAIDLAAFAAVAYPATARDRVICAVARAIVEVLGDTSSIDHLDLLLLATHPDWTKRFLTAVDRQSLDAAITRAPTELVLTGGEAVRWKDARDHLESQGLVAVDRSSNAQVISIGAASTPRRHDSERVGDVVRLASKALQTARTLQKSTAVVDAETKAVLQLFEDHRKLQLATA
jgi:hypothetical protein